MNYANIKYFDIADGPGVRVSLFVSGCRNHCKNCFNKETWSFTFGNEFTQDIENQILDALNGDFISGLTILGGEPFEIENQKGLLSFIKKVKEKYPNKTIWMYSGYIFEKDMIPENGKVHCEVTKDILSLIDILVDGPFVEELKRLDLNFRGSSNQRIIKTKESIASNRIILDELNN